MWNLGDHWRPLLNKYSFCTVNFVFVIRIWYYNHFQILGCKNGGSKFHQTLQTGPADNWIFTGMYMYIINCV